MPDTEITIKFDPNDLPNYSDEFLAFLWHLAQHNPAPHGDYQAGEIASQIGFEIIRRWLRNAPAEMYAHQQRNNYWKWLTRFAKYQPPEGSQPDDERAWHSGQWVLKEPAEEAKDA